MGNVEIIFANVMLDFLKMTVLKKFIVNKTVIAMECVKII